MNLWSLIGAVIGLVILSLVTTNPQQWRSTPLSVIIIVFWAGALVGGYLGCSTRPIE
jgi:ascorbate-specific PTS system EIIC-type component UlaA